MNNNTFSFSDLLNESSGTIDNMNITNLTVDTLVGNTATISQATISTINGSTASINNITGITGYFNNLTGISATFDNLKLNNLTQTSFLGSSNKQIIPYGLTGTINQVITNYGVNGCTLSLPQNIHTSATPTFGNLQINGTITSTNNYTQNFSGGWVSGDLGIGTGYAGLRNNALTGSQDYCLSQNNLGDVLYNSKLNKLMVFANGGNHTFRVINKDLVEFVSTVDASSATNAPITFAGGVGISKKVYCNGLGTFNAGISATSINTSSITTTNIESISNTLNIGSNTNTNTLNLACSSGVQTVNIGLGGVARTNINIGGVNDVVSIGGTLTYVNSTNLDITNNQIFINSNGTTLTARGAGVIISTQGGTYSGWIREDTTSGQQFLFKPVESPYQLNTPTLIDNSEIITSKETQTITGNKTFTNVSFSGISGSTVRCGDLIATTADIRGLTAGIILAGSIASSQLLGTTLFFGSATGTTLNCQGATINILKTNDIISNNIFGTTMIFSTGGGTTLSVLSAILGGATASKLLRVDANKNIVSSSFDDSNFVDTSSNQIIGGIKEFINSTVVNNLSINGSMITQLLPTKLLTLNSTNVQSCDVSNSSVQDTVVFRGSDNTVRCKNVYIDGVSNTDKFCFIDSNYKLSTSSTFNGLTFSTGLYPSNSSIGIGTLSTPVDFIYTNRVYFTVNNKIVSFRPVLAHNQDQYVQIPYWNILAPYMVFSDEPLFIDTSASGKTYTIPSSTNDTFVMESNTQTITGSKTFTNIAGLTATTTHTKDSTILGNRNDINFKKEVIKNFTTIAGNATASTITITCNKSVNSTYTTGLLRVRVSGSAQMIGSVYSVWDYQIRVENGSGNSTLISQNASATNPTINFAYSGNNTTATTTFTITVKNNAGAGNLTGLCYAEFIGSDGFDLGTTWTMTIS